MLWGLRLFLNALATMLRLLYEAQSFRGDIGSAWHKLPVEKLLMRSEPVGVISLVQSGILDRGSECIVRPTRQAGEIVTAIIRDADFGI